MTLDRRARRRLVRYAATGVLVTGLHFAIALSLIHLAGFGPGAANAAAFTLATAVSYLVNTLWSFQAELSSAGLVRFWAVAGAGLVLSWTIGGLAGRLGLSPVLGVACVAAIVPAFSFSAHHLWTFAQDRQAGR